MDQRTGLIKLALFGSPIKSSLSPRIHRLFAAQFDLEIEYKRFDTQAEGFARALEAFRLSGGIGCNITLPLKGEAWRLAKNASVEVAQAQAANTLIWQPPRGWFAHNTDGAGLLADLQTNQGFKVAGKRLLILGAGGAVAGILGNLQAAAPTEIMFVNRNLERANALAERFGDTGKITVTSWGGLVEQGSFDLVINATSLGHNGEAPPITAALFSPDALCYDLNYYRASQPLKSRCQELDQQYIDGLGMLVEQAAKSFNIWTGKQAVSKGVIEACRKTVGSE